MINILMFFLYDDSSNSIALAVIIGIIIYAIIKLIRIDGGLVGLANNGK